MTIDMDIPSCFGKLEIVFPPREDGLRHSPSECMSCDHKTKCLRTALSSQEGLLLTEKKVNQDYFAGRIGFFRRWATRKEIDRKRSNKP